MLCVPPLHSSLCSVLYLLHKNMQSSSIEKTTLASQFAATDVLIAGIERGCLESLVNTLKNHSVPPEDAKTLLSLLQGLGIDFSAVYSALSDTEERHCLRCHQTYQECTNGPEVCVIKLTHILSNQPEEGQGGLTPVDVCFWHIANPEELQFPWLADQCEQLGCNKV